MDLGILILKDCPWNIGEYKAAGTSFADLCSMVLVPIELSSLFHKKMMAAFGGGRGKKGHEQGHDKDGFLDGHMRKPWMPDARQMAVTQLSFDPCSHKDLEPRKGGPKPD